MSNALGTVKAFWRAFLKIQIFEFELELEVPRGGIGEITLENTLGDIGGWIGFYSISKSRAVG
jgi:hypothetical protein